MYKDNSIKKINFYLQDDYRSTYSYVDLIINYKTTVYQSLNYNRSYQTN